MSSTKNTKGNRKVVRAEYHAPERWFKIPDGLDLEDESVVENWYVRYGDLFIKYVGIEQEEEIESCMESESDYQRPTKFEIENADDFGIDYSDDEEEEEVSDTLGAEMNKLQILN